MLKLTNKICIVIICGFLSLPASTLAFIAPLPQQSGSLETFLKNIDYSTKDINTWVIPSANTQSQFRSVIDAFISGNYYRADILGHSIGYEVIRFDDTDVQPAKAHYILWERAQIPDPNFTGGGTYVATSKGHNAVIQGPHPVFDTNTAKQSIETYLKTNATLLMLGGTHRQNSTSTSPCTNGNYRASDVAHQTDSLFYVAHEQVSNYDSNTLFIQFHGFGSNSLNDLVVQCNSTNNSLVNLSEGVNYVSDPTELSLMQLLHQEIEADGIIDSCLYGNESSILGGTWNVEGRYTNNSTNSCTTNAQTSSRRFLHVEQSYNVRRDRRAEMAQYIKDVLDTNFKGI